MNQRIRELSKEAGFEIDNGPLLPGLTTITMKVGGLYVGVPVEKFAELIIRECADQIDNLVTCDDDGNQMLDCDDVRTELLEHFGVEE